jgi:hypothetical protein
VIGANLSLTNLSVTSGASATDHLRVTAHRWRELAQAQASMITYSFVGTRARPQ